MAARPPRPPATLTRLLAPLTLAALLAACGAAPTRPQWAVEPLLRIEHAGGDDAAALYRVGRYHQQRGELAAAADAYARAIALRPDRLDARNAQAVLLAGQGRQDEAAELLRQLVADFPLEAQPLNNLGYLYHLQGRPEAARAAIEQALRLDPSYEQARANLARLAETVSSTGNTARAATAPRTPAPHDAAPATRAADAAPQPRLQLVQTAPNEFRLEPRAQAPAAASSANAAGAVGIASAAATADGSAALGAIGAPAGRAAPSAPASVAAHADAALQIVNGNGVRGLAERVRGVLRRHGVAGADADTVNGRSRQRVTLIEYAPGQRERAEAVRAALDGRVRLVAARALPDALALRLVLGRDYDGPGATGNAARSTRRASLRAKAVPDSAAPPLLASSVAAPVFNQE